MSEVPPDPMLEVPVQLSPEDQPPPISAEDSFMARGGRERACSPIGEGAARHPGPKRPLRNFPHPTELLCY